MRFLYLLLFPILLLSCTAGNRPVWDWSLESRCYGRPVIDGENVYIVSQSGEVISGKFKNGEKNWSVKVDGPVLAEPDYSDKYIFIATQNGFVYALDKQDGKTIWKKNLDPDHFVAPLTLWDDLLIVPSRDGNLYGMSAGNGEAIWKHSGNKKYNTKAIISDPYIFIGGWENDFYCLRKDGTVNWRFKASHVIVEPALIHRNVVYFTAHDHFVYALDVPTGRLIWRFQATYPTELLMIRNELVFGSKSDLLVLDPQNGKELRRIKTDRNIDRVFSWGDHCIAVSRKMLDIDPKSGEIKTLIQARKPLFKIAFPDGMFVVSDDFNRIYGYKAG
jgi:outer membrane protein assembly factor BamB